MPRGQQARLKVLVRFWPSCDANGYLKNLCVYCSSFERLLSASELASYSCRAAEMDDKQWELLFTNSHVAASTLSGILAEGVTAPGLLLGVPAELAMGTDDANMVPSNEGRTRWDLSVFSLKMNYCFINGLQKIILPGTSTDMG